MSLFLVFSLAIPLGQFVRVPASLALMLLLSPPERCPWTAEFLRVTLERSLKEYQDAAKKINKKKLSHIFRNFISPKTIGHLQRY